MFNERFVWWLVVFNLYVRRARISGLCGYIARWHGYITRWHGYITRWHGYITRWHGYIIRWGADVIISLAGGFRWIFLAKFLLCFLIFQWRISIFGRQVSFRADFTPVTKYKTVINFWPRDNVTSKNWWPPPFLQFKQRMTFWPGGILIFLVSFLFVF